MDEIKVENTRFFYEKQIEAVNGNSLGVHLEHALIEANFWERVDISRKEIIAISNAVALSPTLTSVFVSIESTGFSAHLPDTAEAGVDLRDTFALYLGSAIGLNPNLEHLDMLHMESSVPTPSFCDLFWEGCLKSKSIKAISLIPDPVESLASLTKKLVERFTSTGIKLPHLQIDWIEYERGIDEVLTILEDRTALSSAVEFLTIRTKADLCYEELGPVFDALANNTKLLGFGFEIYEGLVVPLKVAKQLADAVAKNRYLKRFSANRLSFLGVRLLADGIARSETLEGVTFEELDNSETTKDSLRIGNVACKFRALGSKNLHDPNQVHKDEFWGKKLVSFVHETNATPSDDPLTDLSVLYRWINDYPNLFVQATGVGTDFVSQLKLENVDLKRENKYLKRENKYLKQYIVTAAAAAAIIVISSSWLG